MGAPPTRTRLAHPTRSLELIRIFYGDLLGLPEISSFTDHEGFSGVIFGLPDADHQLEFTFHESSTEEVRWSNETLLVFYMDSRHSFDAMVRKLDESRAERVMAENPFWQREGITFLDPDGRRIVITQI